MTAPLISILLPVLNGQDHVAAAIRSLLHQSCGDFELIVLDDGSSDGTVNIVKGFQDPRVRLILNGSRMGVARTLNRGLELARGRYIARMDGDDISAPRRLEKQLRYFEDHPKTGVLGTSLRVFGRLSGRHRVPVGPDCVLSFLLFGNPISHPSVMIRRDVFDAGLRYNPDFTRSEDYELWVNAARVCDLDNLDEPLLAFRLHGNSVSSVHRNDMFSQTSTIQGPLLAKMGLELDEAERSFHVRLGQGERMARRADIVKAEQALQRILSANDTTGAFPSAGLRLAAGFVWHRLCVNSAPLGVWVWRQYQASSLSRARKLSWSERVFFWGALVRNRVFIKPQQ